MNTFAMSFQKVEACTSTLRKTSTLWQVTSIQQPESSLNGATPFDLAELLLDKRIPALTGQQKVSPDSVMLKPALINK